jgi:hypothetical protein
MPCIKAVTTLLLAFILPFSSGLLADQLATTEDGRKVKLKGDGTYSLVEQNKGSYKSIEFSDYMLDREELVGERIKIKGDANFYNPKNDKYPTGKLYQKHTTIGTGIKINSELLPRVDAKKVHSECAVSCNMELSGTLKQEKNTVFIEAEAIKLVDSL